MKRRHPQGGSSKLITEIHHVKRIKQKNKRQKTEPLIFLPSWLVRINNVLGPIYKFISPGRLRPEYLNDFLFSFGFVSDAIYVFRRSDASKYLRWGMLWRFVISFPVGVHL